MTSWDDRRIFLAVARNGSLQRAANALNINRTTVLRRITAFEKSLGVRLFERFSSGYELTTAGEAMFEASQRIEEEIITSERRIAGRDKVLRGNIKLTLPAPLATHVLMSDIANFKQLYPEITIDIVTSFSMVDLDRREADVAIRVSNNPPDDLVGRRVGTIKFTAYIGKQHIHDGKFLTPISDLGWVAWSDTMTNERWIKESKFSEIQITSVINNPYVAIEAVKAGMGITLLPCCLGDVEPGLERIHLENLQKNTELWILVHPDLRNTARISAFVSYISEALANHRQLLEGIS